MDCWPLTDYANRIALFVAARRSTFISAQARLSLLQKSSLPKPLRIAFIVIISFISNAVSATENFDEITTLKQFERLFIADRSTPPDDINQGWEPVELKDLWSPRRRAQHLEGWYRTNIELSRLPNQDTGIFIARISSVASFWINGVEFANTGSFTGKALNNWNYPQLLTLPNEYLIEGTNTLHIRLKVLETEMGMLYEPSIGPIDALTLLYESSYFFKITASKILSLMMSIGIIIMLIFYVALRLPSSYLWFIGGSVCWVIYSAKLFVVDVLMPEYAWDFLVSFSLYLAVMCYYISTVRMLALNHRKRELIFYSLIIFYVIGYSVLPPVNFALFAFSYAVISALITFAIAWLLCYHGWQRRRLEGSWMLASGSTIVAMIIYDVFFFIFQITAEFGKFPYIPLVATLLGGLIFFRRIISLNSENESMKGSIRTVDSAISTERERLLREIHDGVGGQLVNTLAILQRGSFKNEDIFNSVKMSLDDLRLIISSLEPMSNQGDILGILATVRERLEERLLQAGITLQWQVKLIPETPWFTSEHALQLMRVLQEAITNVLKHANATVITISCFPETTDNLTRIIVQIEDNGVGISSETKAGSYGLLNMQKRAALLHGTLSVCATDVGSMVRLVLPVIIPTTPHTSAALAHVPKKNPPH